MNLSRLFFFGLFGCVIVGITSGAILGVFAEPKFESTAQFEAKLIQESLTSPRFQPITASVDVRHDRLIVGRNIIEMADEEDSLTALKGFEEYSREDALNAIQSRLVANPIGGGLYEARVTAAYPKESKIILNSLLSAYERDLETRFEAARNRILKAKEFDVLLPETNVDNAAEDLWDPTKGFEPVAYSIARIEKATEGIPVNSLAQWLLMGAGLGAALWLILWLLFKMLGYFAFVPLATALFGCVGGFLMYYSATPVYESKASFQITQGYLPTEITPERELEIVSSNIAVQHEMPFAQSSFAEEVLEKAGLKTLDSFGRIPKADVADVVIRNLLIVQDEAEPTIYNLAFRTINPTDSRVVAENLIFGYAKKLERQALDRRNLRIDELKTQLSKEEEAKGEPSPELARETMYLEQGPVSGFEDPVIRSLSEAGFGKRVWPILSTQLMYGTLIGYMLGLGLASILRASLVSQKTNKGE